MAPPYSYIAFEGPLGSGQRDLARRISVALNAELIEDLPFNPFLQDFYKNKNGAAFQTQLFYLLNRWQTLENLKQPSLFHTLKISDFIIEKDLIYAYQNLSDSELALYEKLYPMLTSDRVRPDLVVYLQVSTKRILENLRRRRDPKQPSISPEYVDSIVEAYNRFFFHYSETPVIILNANNVDFERDHTALSDLLSFIENKLRGTHYFSLQSTR